MSFKTTIASDLKDVFLNLSEFADKRTVKYSGVTYTDIPVVISRFKETILGGLEEQAGRKAKYDQTRGLFRASIIMHCALSDVGGEVLEQGKRISVNDQEGGGGYFRDYYIARSIEQMGMLRLDLEMIDE